MERLIITALGLLLILLAVGVGAGQNQGDLEWNTTIESVNSDITIVNGTIFVGGKGLFALDAETGDLLWSFTYPEDLGEESGPPHVGSPAVVAGTAYVVVGGSESAWVSAVDVTSKKEVWRARVPYADGPPVVADGRLYTLSETDRIYAIDAETGKGLWNRTVVRAESDGDESRRSAQLSDVYLSGPNVIEETIFIGSNLGHAIAIDATDGSAEWETVFENFSVWNDPLVVDDRLYLGGAGGDLENTFRVLALDRDTGEVLWRYDRSFGQTPPRGRWRGRPYSLTTTSDAVYGVLRGWTSQGTVAAIDTDNGSLLWESQKKTARPPLTVVNDTIYAIAVFARDKDFVALNRSNGTIKWRRSLDDPEARSPIVVDGTIYASLQEEIIAINASTKGSSEDAYALQGLGGHHDSYSEIGPVQPGDPRLDSVDYGPTAPDRNASPAGGDGEGGSGATGNASAGDAGEEGVPGFTVMVAVLAVVAALGVVRRGG